jgi:hypothetical protein
MRLECDALAPFHDFISAPGRGLVR